MALTDNLLAYWDMEGDSVDGVAGTYNGSDTSMAYGSSYGKISQGALFNGTTPSRIRLGAGAPAYSYALSISAWVYVTGVPNSGLGSIFSTRKTSPEYGYMWCWGSDNKVNMIMYNSSTPQAVYTSTTASTQNAWHFVVVTISASGGVTFYLDGSADGTASWTGGALPSTSNTYIGTGQDNEVFYFQGRMDEVGFWNREITSTEVTTLYNGGGGKTYSGGAFIDPPSTATGNFFQFF